MEFTTEDIQQAYIKLKSYIYYDNTDILLRSQLVEFETNMGKDLLSNNINSHYNIGENYFSTRLGLKLEEKFERIARELNIFHKGSEFFNYLLDKIDINFYPKKIKNEKEKKNYITNVRIKDNYEIDRVTPFINAPIELHIISVLWIMKHGILLDSKLGDECLGNRLLLNKDKTELVQGSGLFKPYFNQYQKWRDDAVEVAENILKKGKSVAFINLDIKDYFSSVRINSSDIFTGRKYNALNQYYNLAELFLKVHEKYSILLAREYQNPYYFYNELLGENNNIEKVVLPIGLVSSYVLANHYLKEFDERITNIVKPSYYGRYVDDMLFVISNPTPDFKINQSNSKLKFDISRYNSLNPSTLDTFILEIFYPIIDLRTDKNKENVFILEGYDSLYCQSEKSLIHYFDSKESHLVIDRLKQELDERTSEFRDFPEENENDLSFTSSAYHLYYDGSEGKIRTLKDYKENRFGLTVFLSNKIFSALRHKNHLSDEECDQIINFFKGETCLTFYRLWEKILTLLLVNQKPKHYVEFFLHCFNEIEKIKFTDSSIHERIIMDTLVDYLDTAHEISLSLNLNFLNNTKQVTRNFEFKLNQLKTSNWSFLFGRFQPTKPDSYWLKRFRLSNMMRHHYVIHPLLTYTLASKKGVLKDLTSINIDFQNYKLDEYLITNSPRRIKYWECCMSIAFESLSIYGRQKEKEVKGGVETDVLCIKTKKKNKIDEFYLDEAFERFLLLNKNHIPSYELNDKDLRNNIYKRKNQQKRNSPIVNTQEIIVGNQRKKNQQFRIAFANTSVNEPNIISSIRGTPNLSSERYDKLARIVKKARMDRSDVLLFPEFFIPINLLSSIVKYSERNEVLVVTGLEHIKIQNTIFNFIVTILPFELNGVKDAVVVFRLKNHYAHSEELLINGNHYKTALPNTHRYDIFNWENLYFCPYYCFELANVWHRSLFKGKLDLLIGVEWNKDTNYFSNIVESCSRDLHCYVAQVNTSQFGDSRLTQPVESARLDILRLKGGLNDSILVADIDLKKLREFQRKTFEITNQYKEYKPLPPDYDVNYVLKRINNESIL